METQNKLDDLLARLKELLEVRTAAIGYLAQEELPEELRKHGIWSKITERLGKEDITLQYVLESTGFGGHWARGFRVKPPEQPNSIKLEDLEKEQRVNGPE